MGKVVYAANGKRDLHQLESEYDNALAAVAAEEWKHPANKHVVLEYLRDCKLGRAKSGGINLKIGKGTLYRILGILRLASESWLKKDFDKTTQADWDKFYEDMEEDKIYNEHHRKYKQSTKAKTYKTLRKFLKWRFGENKHYPAFCDNWVTREERVTKDYLTRSEIDKLVESTSTLRIKALVMILFDGGFRIEELANLRWADVKKTDKGYYKAHVRKETTKTKKERYVSLLLSTDLIDSFKNSEKNKNKDFDENGYMFETSYNKLYTTINRIGKKVLNKKVSPHTLRHSSATFYADIIKTYQQFVTRYGWTLRSSAPQRYFHTVDDQEIAEQTQDHEISKFKNDFEKVKLENAQLRDVIRDMEKSQAKLTSQVERINEFFLKKGMADISKK